MGTYPKIEQINFLRDILDLYNLMFKNNDIQFAATALSKNWNIPYADCERFFTEKGNSNVALSMLNWEEDF